MSLIVVRKVDKPPRWFCLIPGCGATFTEDEERAYVVHMGGCARRNEDRLLLESLRVQAPHLFDPHVAADPELLAWAREHRDEIREGRLRMS